MKYPKHLFGKALKIARQRSDKTPDLVAAIADIKSPTTILNYEKGKHSICVDYFFSLLEALDISLDDLLKICRNDLGWKQNKKKGKQNVCDEKPASEVNINRPERGDSDS